MTDELKTRLDAALFYLQDLMYGGNPEKGVVMCRQLSLEGVAEASYALYEHFCNSEPDTAMMYLKRAVEKAYPPALCELGNKMLLEGEGERTAVELIWKAATADEPRAQYLLGGMYLDGLYGVAKNEKKGFQWTQKAAEKRLVEGMYQLACCYQNGLGVEQNMLWARNIFEQLLRENPYNKEIQESAKTALCLSYLSDPAMENKEKGVDMLTEGEDNALQICMNIGESREMLMELDTAAVLYARAGSLGSAEGYYRAAKLKLKLKLGDVSCVPEMLKQAAEKGHSGAQYALFRVYAVGMYGQTADTKKALYWLNQAGSNRHAQACHQLGNFYTYGVGEDIPKDEQEARRWYELALRNRKYPGWETVLELLNFLLDE